MSITCNYIEPFIPKINNNYIENNINIYYGSATLIRLSNKIAFICSSMCSIAVGKGKREGSSYPLDDAWRPIPDHPCLPAS